MSTVQTVLDLNRKEDLIHFLARRRCLNLTNLYFRYLFHFVQAAGIVVTSYAAAGNHPVLIWTGVSLNMVATLIHVYERTNTAVLQQLRTDIESIQAGTYVDEGQLVVNVEKPTMTSYQSI